MLGSYFLWNKTMHSVYALNITFIFLASPVDLIQMCVRSIIASPVTLRPIGFLVVLYSN